MSVVYYVYMCICLHVCVRMCALLLFFLLVFLFLTYTLFVVDDDDDYEMIYTILNITYFETKTLSSSSYVVLFEPIEYSRIITTSK